LLAKACEVHTPSGRHELVVESWLAWSTRVGCDAEPSPPAAQLRLEQAAAGLGAPLKSLPWQSARHLAKT